MEYGNVGNKFKVAILAAKRAKQIMKTGKKKIDLIAFNPLTIALEEIRQGLVTYETIIEDENNSIINLGETQIINNEGNIFAAEGTSDENIESEDTTEDIDEEVSDEELLKKNLKNSYE